MHLFQGCFKRTLLAGKELVGEVIALLFEDRIQELFNALDLTVVAARLKGVKNSSEKD